MIGWSAACDNFNIPNEAPLLGKYRLWLSEG